MGWHSDIRSYEHCDLLYVGVHITYVGREEDLVTPLRGLTPTRTLSATFAHVTDIDGTEVEVDMPGEWIRETMADASGGPLFAQVDAAVRELERSLVDFRQIRNARACTFCIGVRPYGRTTTLWSNPPHELERRLAALGLGFDVREVYPGMSMGVRSIVPPITPWYESGELRYIAISFCGSILSPRLVTEALALEPTSANEPTVYTVTDHEGSYNESSPGNWYLRLATDATSGLLLPQVEQALTELESVGDACRAMSSAFNGGFTVAISPAGWEVLRESDGELPQEIADRIRKLGFDSEVGVEFPNESESTPTSD